MRENKKDWGISGLCRSCQCDHSVPNLFSARTTCSQFLLLLVDEVERCKFVDESCGRQKTFGKLASFCLATKRKINCWTLNNPRKLCPMMNCGVLTSTLFSPSRKELSVQITNWKNEHGQFIIGESTFMEFFQSLKICFSVSRVFCQQKFAQ